VIEVTATSRGAGEAIPPASTAPDPAPSTDTQPPWGLIGTGIGVTLVAGGVALGGPGRRDPVGPAGLAGRAAWAGLGGALSGGPSAGDQQPQSRSPDLKQFLWDWGGHIIGAAVVLVSVLSTPVSATGVAVGVVVVAASEAKRRWWPSKPQTANDMLGGNPYQTMQESGNAGIGQKVRDAHGSGEVVKELGEDGKETTSWAQSQRTVQQETGGGTQSLNESRRQINNE
jgi:hypothetical protein